MIPNDEDFRTQDRPLERVRDDKLDRGPFIASLVRALVADERDSSGKLIARRSRGFVVGLIGRWGLGKSTIMHFLADELGGMDRVVVATLNPWLFKGRDEILSAFFSALRRAMGGTKLENAREIMQTIANYEGAIVGTAKLGAKGVELVHGGAIPWLSTLVSKIKFWKPKALSIDAERKSLEQKLKASGGAVVVLIDELDRVEDEEVRAVAQLVKAVGEIKGISYLVAYDPPRVIEALGRGSGEERRTSGERYLEKIVQHGIPLRPLFDEDVRPLLAAALEASGVECRDPITQNERDIFEHIVGAIVTPREVKRLIGSFAVIEAAVRGEVNPIDVLGYCWVLTRAPRAAELIAADPALVLDDPGEAQQIIRSGRGMTGGPEEHDILLAAAGDEAHLLRMMFPRLGTTREGHDGDRISRRQNLLRVLYLGNPPSLFRRQEIEAIWGLDREDLIETELRSLKESGRLGAFLDRLDDLLPQLDPEKDSIFWPALSKALERDEDWATAPDPGKSLSEDAARTILRLAVREPAFIPRVHDIIYNLAKNGDLLLVPQILRQEMFNLGMVYGQPARGGFNLYDPAGVRKLMDHEIPRYREAIESGQWLRRVPSAELVFVIYGAREWDGKLQMILTEQARDPRGFVTLATLMTPPGQMVETSVLNEIVRGDDLSAEFAEQELPIGDEWLASSVRRLRERLSWSYEGNEQDEQ